MPSTCDGLPMTALQGAVLHGERTAQLDLDRLLRPGDFPRDRGSAASCPDAQVASRPRWSGGKCRTRSAVRSPSPEAAWWPSSRESMLQGDRDRRCRGRRPVPPRAGPSSRSSLVRRSTWQRDRGAGSGRCWPTTGRSGIRAKCSRCVWRLRDRRRAPFAASAGRGYPASSAPAPRTAAADLPRQGRPRCRTSDAARRVHRLFR